MMLSLMYLLIFVVWAIAVIMLKCKNAKTKRQAEEAAAMASATAATSPDSTVHVIQIGSNYYDVVAMPQNHTQCQQQQSLNMNYPPRYSQYRSIEPTSVAQSNPAFILDEGGVFPTTTSATGDIPIEPPPSYEEVMKVPKNYPRSDLSVPTISITNQR